MDVQGQAHSRPIHVVRWDNFRALLRDRGMSLTAAAVLLSKSQGQVSHFGGKTPIKPIGDQIAAEIEVAFALPHGSLDNPQSDADLERLANAIATAQALVEVIRKRRMSANNSFKPKPLRGSA